MKGSPALKKKQKKFIKRVHKTVEHSPQPKVSFPKSTKHQPFFSLFKRYFGDLLLLIVPVTLFGIFLILTIINDYYTTELAKNQLAPFPTQTHINPYPFVQHMPLLSLSAKSAIVVDSDSQIVLFSKNPQLRFSMASTTKIMTALTALEHFQDNAILTVRTGRVDGTGLGLVVGDQFYFKDLLYAMLLPSANDAAVAIADNYPGGSEAFIARMNEKAAEMHLTNTHFADPTGLTDDGDYTTVIDLSRLASLAIKNKEFAMITGTKQRTITTVNGTKQYVLHNLNRLLGFNGVTGIKTGTTEAAGEVLVTSAVIKGHTYIIVVMNSEDRFADTQQLLSFINQGVTYLNLSQY